MTAAQRCKICKQTLENAASIAKGIGPECSRKFEAMLSGAGLTLPTLGISESIATNPLVALQLGRAQRALLAGNKRDLEVFKAAAIRAARRLALPNAARDRETGDTPGTDVASKTEVGEAGATSVETIF